MTPAKRCPKCGETKPADHYFRRHGGLALGSYCKPCTRAAARSSQHKRLKGTGRGGWLGNRKTWHFRGARG